MSRHHGLRALIAAAGRGSRAGLPYPKTLYPIDGSPILLRIARVLSPYDPSPTIIVSPAGMDPVGQCLASAGLTANLVVQPEPRGMGDAVLRFEMSPVCPQTEHILLVWGDIPFIQPETVAALVERHFAAGNDFTLATRHVDSAYTVVSRNPAGKVTGVVETRERGDAATVPGERDIGLFLFRKQPVFAALAEDLPGKWGKATGEHGFLYIVGHLAARGLRIEALPVATELDLVSLNSLKDVEPWV
jgi:bifunctional UDP-N-acetylglucosamine pyrophosphorylase / glucosamine-1-phosphate N-acetyltransferase